MICSASRTPPGLPYIDLSLDWTPEQYDAHFARDDVKLVALTRDGKPAAFAELEFHPEEGRAEVTYLAVHPAERGQKLGRTLLSLAASEARRYPELRSLRVRAHDHRLEPLDQPSPGAGRRRPRHHHRTAWAGAGDPGGTSPRFCP